ncbi:MAG: hypothetical protein P8163_03495 [Candidatus Thiodiazotropha sp.]
MPHKLRLNLILVAIIALLALLIWQSQPQPRVTLSKLVPAEIHTITISTDTTSHTMRLVEGQWVIEGAAGLSSRIEQLLTISQTPSLSRFAAPPDLKPYGLDKPKLVLQLNQETFFFGNIEPLSGWRYVLHSGVIHLIGNGFQHHLAAPIEAWQEDPDA